jgi:hypothetical protein
MEEEAQGDQVTNRNEEQTHQRNQPTHYTRKRQELQIMYSESPFMTQATTIFL